MTTTLKWSLFGSFVKHTHTNTQIHQQIASILRYEEGAYLLSCSQTSVQVRWQVWRIGKRLLCNPSKLSLCHSFLFSCSIALFLKNFPADIFPPISVHHICLGVILPFFCSCMLWSLLLPVHSLPKWAQKGNQKAPGREEREDRVHLRPNKEQALIIYCPPQPLANHRPLQG